MFTGIVQEVGRVKAVSGKGLLISAQKVLEGTKPGDSIAVNGACLTVTSVEVGGFRVELMEETRRRTNLGGLRPGEMVNLEPAMKLGERLGGHLVQGHIDAPGRVLSVSQRADSRLVRFSAPPHLLRYLVPQGFIAVDGVSLTVVECDTSSFTVSLVGYTLEHTSLGKRKPGDAVNLEVDIMAKYAERFQGRGGVDPARLEAFLQG